MDTVYLNGAYMALAEARISPLDRGFLFGDGVYEVIPTYGGRVVGFAPHIDRLNRGLQEIGIELSEPYEYWQQICEQLSERNGGENLGLYLHLSRGADIKRAHAFPEGIEPTVFGHAFEIPECDEPDREKHPGFKLHLAQDLRWRRCHIKTTSLLGNVMLFQQGLSQGNDETILYNGSGELTEGAMSNVFIVENGVVSTPVQDNQILGGITRYLTLDILREKTDIPVQERVITVHEVRRADEIWVTNSIDGIAPATSLDGARVGDGKPGRVWEVVAKAYEENKFFY
ncbi:MAG: D-alanine transaminase [Halieaceae bacterium]|jgi:D-alanine transaminase